MRKITLYSSRPMGMVMPVFLLLSSYTFSPETARAQVDLDDQPPIADATDRIRVTGTRLKQIDLEGPQPLEILDRNDLARSGMANMGEILNNLPAVSFGSFRSGAGYGDADFQSVNLRGLGSQNTLILVNGKRLHKDPYFQSSDITNIPLAAVERVEILKGTASAIYGSDALGGVVNIILRDDFEGGEVNVYHTFPKWKGGREREISAVYGFTGDNWRNISVLQWRHQDPIYMTNRPWVEPNESTIGFPASYRGADGTYRPVVEGCAGANVISTSVGDFCGFNIYEGAYYQGENERINAINDFNWDINNRWSLNVRLMATHKRTFTNLSQNGIDSRDGYSVSAARAQELVNEGRIAAENITPGEDVPIITRLVEAGRRETQSESLSLTTSVGITRYFDNDFELELSIHDSRIDREAENRNFLHEPTLQAMIASGEFDVFAAGNRGDLSRATLRPLNTVESSTQIYNAILSGPLFQYTLTGFALGYSHMAERYQNKYDAETIAGNVLWSGGGDGEGSRSVNSLFGELGLSPIENLDVTVALRFDSYDDFGSSFNPNLAFTYRPLETLLLKASWGTGFKAPPLRDIHDQEAVYYTSVTDHTKCEEARQNNNPEDIERYCNATRSVEIIAGGNPDLEEEKSTSWNFGVGFEPRQGYGLSLDYWYTEIEDQISRPDSDDVMRMEARGEVLPAGSIVNRDPNTGDVTRVILPTTNIAATKTSGLDFGIYLNERTRVGTLGFNSRYSKTFSYKTEKIPGAGFEETIGDVGQPSWRLNNTFTYGLDRHSWALTNVNIASYSKNVEEAGKVGEFTRWDTQYSYMGAWDGTITVGYINLFHKLPPLDDTAGPARGVSSGLYGFEGPRLYVSYSQRF